MKLRSGTNTCSLRVISWHCEFGSNSDLEEIFPPCPSHDFCLTVFYRRNLPYRLRQKLRKNRKFFVVKFEKSEISSISLAFKKLVQKYPISKKRIHTQST